MRKEVEGRDLQLCVRLQLCVNDSTASHYYSMQTYNASFVLAAMATVCASARRGGLEVTNRLVGPTTVAFIEEHYTGCTYRKRKKVTDEIIQIVNE